MYRTLIVARMDPGDAGAVAEAFARSDQTELPRMLGVHGRALFRFHDLYFHLVESRNEIAAPLDRVREHPLFTGLSSELARFVSPFSPDWQGPRDAMAQCFYTWESAESERATASPVARPASPGGR
ncbi:TcmI family type II polyketide cyclase [Streptomyces dysideae]|uniref:TcmI family type II polyketide cyclase n=1 Tax=Streptomyces dysideae TaxID=909626 RepID=UPI000B016985|nr:TcmI family type II polyketide cyclase [Streptomyces dysideae]